LNLTWKRRMEQIRQRWWVVVVVAALGVLVAASSLLTHPMYMGKSTLVLAGRTPEQDAVMILGYLTLFNDPATIPRLRTTTKIPEDVTFEARTAAASPILTIEATADDPKTAQEAAKDMAEAFRADINAVQGAGSRDHAAELESKLKEVPPVNPDGSANAYYASLQERIDTIRSGGNELQLLQPRVGVTENRPSIVLNLVAGAVGGLLLGILAALGLAALSTRLTNAADLRDKTGVEPLVEVPAAGSVERDRLRQDRLRTLANLVSLEDLPKPTVIALTDSRGDRGARDIAEALAELSAQQGGRTVLIYADNDPSQPAGSAGFNDALADSSLAHEVLIDGDVESLKILPAGSTLADRYSMVTRERIVAVLDELRTDADTIIVAAPAIADTTDAQLVCGAADVTILVVTRRSSRAGDVTSAAEALAKAHAFPWAAVLIDRPDGKHRGRRSPRSQTPGPPSKPRTEMAGWVLAGDCEPSFVVAHDTERIALSSRVSTSWPVSEQDHA
jgi:succinoglycan biosynthesis transport protein ExoP